jgi:hypothetical protein
MGRGDQQGRKQTVDSMVRSTQAASDGLPRALAILRDQAGELIGSRTRQSAEAGWLQASGDAFEALWLALDVMLSPPDDLPSELATAEGSRSGPSAPAATLRAQLAPLLKLPTDGNDDSLWFELRRARLEGAVRPPSLPDGTHLAALGSVDAPPTRGPAAFELLSAELRIALTEAGFVRMASWVTPVVAGHLACLLALLSADRMRGAQMANELEQAFPVGVREALSAILELVVRGRRSSERVLKGSHDAGASDTEPPVPEASEPSKVPSLAGDDVQFTVYRPASLAPARWSKLLAFAHLAHRRADAEPRAPDPIETVQQQAEALLGADLARYRQLSEDAGQPIPYEGQLTFLPDVPDVAFDPPSASFRWVDDVHRVEFRLRPDAKLAGQTARGQLTVLCGSILVAELSLSLRVDQSAQAEARPPEVAESARMYRKIFASYSHADGAIVTQFREHAKALGDRYLIDVSELRSGEVWSAALERLIREADVFQLFWSSNSMRSPFVQQEWEYAMNLGRDSFVRPTYWEQPMPEPPQDGLPPQLARLHFQSLCTSALGAGAGNADAQAAAPAQARPSASAEASAAIGAPTAKRGWDPRRWIGQLTSALVAAAALLLMVQRMPNDAALPPDVITPAPDRQGPQPSEPSVTPTLPPPQTNDTATPPDVVATPEPNHFPEPATGPKPGVDSAHGRQGAPHHSNAPKIRLGAPVVAGALAPEVVRRSVRQRLGFLRLCYEAALAKDSKLEGGVGVTFVIDADGSVSQAPTVESDIADAELGRCFAKRLSEATFPLPESGNVKVSLPFLLTPGDA